MKKRRGWELLPRREPVDHLHALEGRCVDSLIDYWPGGWGLHNIRGISSMFWSDSTAYLVKRFGGWVHHCVPSTRRRHPVPDGVQTGRPARNYSVAAFGQNLLISNCAVGPNDKNLWYYWVDGNNYGVTLKDSVNLRVNPSAPQVFNFSTIWGVFQRPSRLLFVDRRRCALGWHN